MFNISEFVVTFYLRYTHQVSIVYKMKKLLIPISLEAAYKL